MPDIVFHVYTSTSLEENDILFVFLKRNKFDIYSNFKYGVLFETLFISF